MSTQEPVELNQEPEEVPSQPDVEAAELNVNDILQKLKNGTLSPKSLNPETRRACVSHMLDKDGTILEIASLFRVNERTIARDVREIRKRRALKPDANFASEFIGHMIHRVELACSDARRAAREKSATPADRIEANRMETVARFGLFDKLQSAGYLPRVGQQITATLTHQVEQLSVAGLSKEIERLQALARTRNSDPTKLVQLQEAKNQLALIEVKEQVVVLGSGIENEGESNDSE